MVPSLLPKLLRFWRVLSGDAWRRHSVCIKVARHRWHSNRSTDAIRTRIFGWIFRPSPPDSGFLIVFLWSCRMTQTQASGVWILRLELLGEGWMCSQTLTGGICFGRNLHKQAALSVTHVEISRGWVILQSRQVAIFDLELQPPLKHCSPAGITLPRLLAFSDR